MNYNFSSICLLTWVSLFLETQLCLSRSRPHACLFGLERLRLASSDASYSLLRLANMTVKKLRNALKQTCSWHRSFSCLRHLESSFNYCSYLLAKMDSAYSWQTHASNLEAQGVYSFENSCPFHYYQVSSKMAAPFHPCITLPFSQLQNCCMKGVGMLAWTDSS